MGLNNVMTTTWVAQHGGYGGEPQGHEEQECGFKRCKERILCASDLKHKHLLPFKKCAGPLDGHPPLDPCLGRFLGIIGQTS